MLCNATLGSGLGRLTQMRQDPEWRRARGMVKVKREMSCSGVSIVSID